MQKAFQKVNIPVRIGIHTGEVLLENKDVIGDAVLEKMERPAHFRVR